MLSHFTNHWRLIYLQLPVLFRWIHELALYKYLNNNYNYRYLDKFVCTAVSCYITITLFRGLSLELFCSGNILCWLIILLFNFHVIWLCVCCFVTMSSGGLIVWLHFCSVAWLYPFLLFGMLQPNIMPTSLALDLELCPLHLWPYKQLLYLTCWGKWCWCGIIDIPLHYFNVIISGTISH